MTPNPYPSEHTLSRRIGRCSGTLILVPILVLFLGTDWRIRREVGFPSGILVSDSGTSSIELASLPDGSQLDEGELLDVGSYLQLSLSAPVEEFTLTLQADSNDQYRVSASANGDRFDDLWMVPQAQTGGGIQARRPVLFALPAPIQFLRLHPLGGDAPYSLAGISMEHITRIHPVFVIPPLLWVGWLLLYAAEQRSGSGSLPARMLAGWGRIDIWLAIALTYVVLFRVPHVVAAFVLTFLAVCVLVRWAIGRMRTAPLRYALGISSALLLTFVVLQVGLELFVRAVVGRVYDLTIDHRMRPDRDEINEDGIRFRGTAADTEDADYVVLFLGDSFTQGLFLDYTDAYPYVFEQIATEATCSARLRAVNFGWTSSSPVLSLRLLQDIGRKYKPDLIVYNLDMTDFHDDLRYEIALRQGGDFEPDHSRLRVTLGSTFGLDSELGQAFAQLVRRVDRRRPHAGVTLPDDRFFITSQPVEQTRDQIERGVMKNLGALYDYAEEELGSPMVLVIYPRGYQYSTRESPNNWEADRYRTLGPHVQEPFRYFRENQAQLPYPVLSLLPAFVESTQFPLFLRNDPHWTRAGARLAAEQVAGWLAQRSLIPCALSSRWGSER